MGGDKLIERFRHKLAGLYILRYLLYGLTYLAFIGGFCVLTWRMLFGRALPGGLEMIIAGAAVCGVLLFSIVRTLQTIPSTGELRTVFDKINRCGGLLMASLETSIDSWSTYLPTVQAPGITWNGRRHGGVFFAAIVFLAVSFIVPQRYITAHSAGRLEIGEQTRQMQEQIKILEEEHILAEEAARDIRQKVEAIEESALGREPVKTWEALGHIEDQLKKAAEEALVEMLAETEELAKTEALAEALNEIGKDLQPQVMKDAMAELAQRVNVQMKQNEAFKNALGGQLAADAKAGQLSADQLKELAKALQGRKGELSKSMSKLCEADLAKMKLLQMCEKSRQCNSEGLKSLLMECGEAKEALSYFMNNPNWDVDRGRGDAPMIWGDASGKENTAFKEEVLPAASAAALKDAQLVGVSVSAPSAEEEIGRAHV
jgi:CRISPR/Cas system CSM-associated protein Csm2 small subunit